MACDTGTIVKLKRRKHSVSWQIRVIKPYPLLLLPHDLIPLGRWLACDVNLDALGTTLTARDDLAQPLRETSAQSVLLPGCQETCMHPRSTAYFPVAQPLWVLCPPHLHTTPPHFKHLLKRTSGEGSHICQRA